jgi:hypothetical protein
VRHNTHFLFNLRYEDLTKLCSAAATIDLISVPHTGFPPLKIAIVGAVFKSDHTINYCCRLFQRPPKVPCLQSRFFVMTLHTFPATSKPTRTQDKRPHAPRPKLSKEARQVATARQREAATAYSKDLSAAWKTIDEATENIAVKHHKSLQHVQSTLHMGRGAFTRQGSKKTTAWNAYTWKTMKEQRESDGWLFYRQEVTIFNVFIL